MKENIRLDKLISDQLDLSRKQAKAAICAGLVQMDGQVATQPEIKVNPDLVKVTYRNQLLTRKGYSYYMLNKPAGVVTATKDNIFRTVMDLFPEDLRQGLFPIGRLDKDTEGLLLITDDGRLSHDLLSPRKHVPKKYYVETRDSIREDAGELFSEGVDIGEKKLTKPAKLENLGEKQAYLIISEGKFHQVKRMFEKTDNEVTYLKRVEMAGISLDDTLTKGEFRPLREEEVEWLRKSIMQ